MKSDETKKLLYNDAYKIYGHSMSQQLPYDEIKVRKNVKLEDILTNPGDSEDGCFIISSIKAS